MFRHCVMFSWADDVDPGHPDAVSGALDALSTQVPSIRSYRHGPDAGLAPTNADYVVVADFDDVAGFEAYRDHPAHVEFVQGYIAGRVAQRLAVQYHC